MQAIRPDQRWETMLLQIESEYLSDPERHSLEWWHQFVREKIFIDDLRRWAAEQRWDQRRTAYWRGVQAAWLRGQSQLLLTARTKELADAQLLRSGLFEAITPQRSPGGGVELPFNVTSYEGAVRAFVAVDALIENKRDKISLQLVPMLEEAETAVEGGAPTKISANVPLDGNEIRRIAHLLLTEHRESMAVVEDEDDTDNDDDDQTEETAGGGGDHRVEPPGDRARMESKKRPR
jgi:hypothetical protein